MSSVLLRSRSLLSLREQHCFSRCLPSDLPLFSLCQGIIHLAVAIWIAPSTLVAELLPTSAFHVGAPIDPFHPDRASGALLEVFVSDAFPEQLIVRVLFFAALEFLAGLAFMEDDFALQAVALLTYWAHVVRNVVLIEAVVAVWIQAEKYEVFAFAW